MAWICNCRRQTILYAKEYEMLRKIFFSAGLLLALILILTGRSTATPPVNQYLGIYDTDFGNLTRVKCLECHNSDEVLVNRHHALLNNQLPAKTYQCLTCHSLIDDGTGSFSFADFRTCENCHTTSPHHITAAALARQCNVCHGSFVDNFDDGHAIPTYPKSIITPETYGITYTDPVTGVVTVSKGCGACHQPDPNAIDPITSTIRPILSSKQTHHSTRLSCSLCHNIHGALKDIRQCETCHGMKSLHNIQKDSPAAANPGTIVPGEEDQGWGHIGNNTDCNGCHVQFYTAASTGPSTAIVPSINSLSSNTVYSGRNNQFVISGSGFINSTTEASYTPTVVIGNESGSISITPSFSSEGTIQLTIPPLLPGNYDLRVTKGTIKSNRTRITAFPFLSASKAVLGANSTITIVGTGFRTPPPSDYKTDLGVKVNNNPALIISWSETKIVAAIRGVRAGDSVFIKSLNGTASTSVTAAVKKTR